MKILGRNFGGDKYSVPPPANDFAHHGFRAIGFGRVEEERTGLQALPQDVRASVIVRGPNPYFRYPLAGPAEFLVKHLNTTIRHYRRRASMLNEFSPRRHG